ncbi:MAG: Ig-like domain-containing protein [Actinobacteria bacterium]|nr:Ig-like domain-containing protein [Actinomycetota bacterium]
MTSERQGGGALVTENTTRARRLFLIAGAALVVVAGFVAAASAADVTPPTLTSTTPANGATGVPVNGFVTIVFSESMNPSTLTNDLVQLRIGAVPVSAETVVLHADRSRVYVYPDQMMEVNTVYTIWISGTVTDLAGNPLGAAVSRTFTTALTGITPHGGYSNASNLCRNCHSPHGAAAAGTYGGKIFPQSQETDVCYMCHDGTGAATNVKAVFLLAGTGHEVNDSTTVPGPGLTSRCSSCHGAHYPASGAGGKPKLYKPTINATAVTGNNYTWCEACHDDTYSWVVPPYPYPSGGINATRPLRAANGYPTLGTYPGRTTYNNTTYNPHNPTTSTNVIWPSSGRTSGDCRNCHASHRNTATYDALVATYRPTPDAATAQSDRQNGTYALLCFTCHDGSPSTRNILQYVSYDYNLTGPDYTGGHRIFTAGGTLSVGAPLPCYYCHNAHGSKGNNGTQANRKLISDEQWSNIDTTTIAGVVNFCFKCHLPWQRVAGSGDALANTIPAGELTTIVGLDRRTAANKLSLISGITAHGETNRVTPTASCYDCHGNSYAAPSATTGYNVHRPNRGGSCVSCHGVAQDAGDGAPTRRAIVGEFSLTGRHVMGGAVTDKDCGVCHMEGDSATGNIISANHKNNAINFRDPDTGAAAATAVTTFTRNTASNSLEAWVTNVQNNLCFKCHDADGAASTAARVSPGGTALRPFSSNTRDVPNIFSAFATTNNFHHAVRGAGTNPYATPTATNGNVITMVAPWNQTANSHNVISCFDCHIAAGSGHGGTNRYMLRVNVGTIASPNYTGQRDLCIRCHKQSVYETNDAGSRFRDHDIGQHKLSTNAYGCRGCHAGLVERDGATVWNGSPGNIHGGNWTWPSGTGAQTPGITTKAFLYGGWLGGLDPTTAACYGGDCSHKTSPRSY